MTAAVSAVLLFSVSTFAADSKVSLRFNTDYLGAGKQIEMLKEAVTDHAKELSRSDSERYPDPKKTAGLFKIRRRGIGSNPLVEISGPQVEELVRDFSKRVRRENTDVISRKFNRSKRELDSIEKELSAIQKTMDPLAEQKARRYDMLSLEQIRTESEIEKHNVHLLSIKDRLNIIEYQYQARLKRMNELLEQMGSDPSREIQSTQLILFLISQELEDFDAEFSHPSDGLVQGLQKEIYLAKIEHLRQKEAYGENSPSVKVIKKNIDRLKKNLGEEKTGYRTRIRARITGKTRQFEQYQRRLEDLERSAAQYEQLRAEYYQIEKSPPSGESIENLQQKILSIQAELEGARKKEQLIQYQIDALLGNKQKLVELQQRKDKLTARVRGLEKTLSESESGAYDPAIEK